MLIDDWATLSSRAKQKFCEIGMIGAGFVERVIKFYWFIKELWFLMKPIVFITFPNSKRLDQKLIYHEIDFLHAIYDYEIIFFCGVMKVFGRK